MTEHNSAVSLMRTAMALLDRDGMTVSACYLEQAIHEALDQNRVDEIMPEHNDSAAHDAKAAARNG